MTAGARSRVRRHRARKGEGDLLRDELLDATEQLLLEHGNCELVSLRAIAAAVGVTPPSIYMHFADKDELIWSVCTRGFERFDADIEAAVRGIDDPVDRLRARGQAYVRFGLTHPEAYRVLFMHRRGAHPESLAEQTAAGAGALARLVENVEACLAAGRIDPGDPFAIAVGLWTTVHGITSLAITSEHFPAPLDLDGLVDHVVCTHLAGLGARRA